MQSKISLPRKFVPSSLSKSTNILLIAALALLLAAVACGSGTTVVNPTGNFSKSSLSGTYVYSFAGTDTNGDYREAGLFTADANGNITAGSDDFAQGGSLATNATTGTYSIASDGTGTLTLVFPGTAGSINLAITMLSTSSLDLIEADTFANGAGSAEKQDTTAATTLPSGTFVFRLQSASSITGSSAAVGAMNLSGGSITGNDDVIRAGTPQQLTLSGIVVAPSSNGRGTLALTDSGGVTTNLVYYVVNAGTLRFLQSDGAALSLGRGEKQTLATFTTASLSGGFAFGSGGDTASNQGGAQTVGAFTTDGNGNITAGAYDSQQDSVTASNVSFTGNYTIASNGRAQVSFTPAGGTGIVIPHVFWLVSPNRAMFLETTLNKVESGTADKQNPTTFANSNLGAQAALVMHGFDTELVDRVGTLTPDGKGNVTLNYLLNRGGTVTAPGTLPGTYTVSSNGRTVLNVNSLTTNLVLYLVSNNSGYLLQGDTGTEISGQVAQQTSP